ncbi:MAG: hypothetical protein FWD99_06400 [Oscillospiraceae bacterium]|nr:hypothetical protein [Oscillospiraceae bacterium]
MKEKLIVRLGELGITPSAEDDLALDALLLGAKRRLLAETGQKTLPQALEATVVDMAAGEYLFFRRNTGRLEGFDAGQVVRQISQGDTSVTYETAGESGSPLDGLIARLSTPPPELVVKWRRIQW